MVGPNYLIIYWVEPSNWYLPCEHWVKLGEVSEGSARRLVRVSLLLAVKDA
jgi:hypothetical protein